MTPNSSNQTTTFLAKNTDLSVPIRDTSQSDGHASFTARTLLVNLGQKTISRLRDSSRCDTGENTRTQRDTDNSGLAHLIFEEKDNFFSGGNDVAFVVVCSLTSHNDRDRG